MRTTIVALFLVAAGMLCVGQSTLAASGTDSGYRVGERRAAGPVNAPRATYKETGWKALVPTDWDPMKAFNELDLGQFDDADPRAMRALEKLRKGWDNAPVRQSMNGERVRIPGFAVPLERQRDQVTEFLLVPYFGACIHVPPPPSNQVIHVFPAKPLKSMQTMDAIWISGVLETVRSTTGMGNAGYRMRAEIVTPYQRPSRGR
jgi:hypothetical protein